MSTTRIFESNYASLFVSARNEKAPESSENKTYGMKTMDILKRLQFDRHIFCKSHNPGRSSYVDKQSVIGQTGMAIGYVVKRGYHSVL